MTQYAMYGGSFDPIHIGHISIVERAVAMGYKVFVVPAYRHAFGKQSAPYDHRVHMCELALDTDSLQGSAQVCTIERSLAKSDDVPIYTYDVLCRLRDHFGSAPCLLVGPDIATEWERWYCHAEIDQEFGRLALPMIHPVRSSMIREQLQSGQTCDDMPLCVPNSVRAYIKSQGLYCPD